MIEEAAKENEDLPTTQGSWAAGAATQEMEYGDVYTNEP